MSLDRKLSSVGTQLFLKSLNGERDIEGLPNNSDDKEERSSDSASGYSSEDSASFANMRSLGKAWSTKQDEDLIDAVLQHGDDWDQISEKVRGHTADECEQRWLARTKAIPYKEKLIRSFSSTSSAKDSASESLESPRYSPWSLHKARFLKKVITTDGIILVIDKLMNGYSAKVSIKGTRYYIKLTVDSMVFTTRSVAKDSGSSSALEVKIKDIFRLPSTVGARSLLTFGVYIKHRVRQDEEIGKAEICAGTLAERPFRDLILLSSDNVVMHKSAPVILRVRIAKNSLPESWPVPNESIEAILATSKEPKCPKHVMMITRGTRGDIQPFIALARGLSEYLGWMVTICTELRYREYIKQNSAVKKGCIRFRPSGGDTMKRMDSNLVRWATSLESNNMQRAMLAYAEREFFESEPALFYWASVMKPDMLIFGFTLTNIAMIISEALNIPLLGFILQPTCMPSKQYPPVVPLNVRKYQKWSMKKNKLDAYENLEIAKVLFENNPLTGRLNAMRARRGLKRYALWDLSTGNVMSETWRELMKNNIPIVVPINAFAFGGKPDDWHENAVLTNYIFLQGKTVPELSTEHLNFINETKKLGGKLVVLAFSSMPVLKQVIYQIACKLVRECKKKVSVMALIGDHTNDSSVTEDVGLFVSSLIQEQRLLVDIGAPFGKLFPLADAIVAHGGLGTTAEAICAKVPVITTGVQLMDQRFWGSRCYSLGIGPYPVHINRFLKHCVALVDEALKDGSEWAQNARIIGAKVSQTMAEDPSGVLTNVQAVQKLAENAVPYMYRPEEDD